MSAFLPPIAAPLPIVDASEDDETGDIERAGKPTTGRTNRVVKSFGLVVRSKSILLKSLVQGDDAVLMDFAVGPPIDQSEALEYSSTVFTYLGAGRSGRRKALRLCLFYTLILCIYAGARTERAPRDDVVHADAHHHRLGFQIPTRRHREPRQAT